MPRRTGLPDRGLRGRARTRTLGRPPQRRRFVPGPPPQRSGLLPTQGGPVGAQLRRGIGERERSPPDRSAPAIGPTPRLAVLLPAHGHRDAWRARPTLGVRAPGSWHRLPREPPTRVPVG